MAVQGTFATVFEDIFCSPQAAENRASVSGLIIEKLYDKVDLDRLFTVVSPVRTGDPAVALIYNAVYNAVKNTNALDCAITSCDVEPEYQAKVWAIALAECRHALCTRSLDEKFLAFWGKYKRANPGSDEYDFAVEQISDMLSDLIANTLLAKLWLSDTTFQAVPGTIDDLLDGIDGFFVQATGDTTNKVDAGATKLTGKDLYDKIVEAITLYQGSNFGATLSDAIIYIDRTDAFGLVSWLNGAGRMSGYDCTCIDPDGVVRADRYTVDGFQIHGIEVRTQPFEDMMAQFTEYSTLGVPTFHNFVLITPQSNMLVGTGNEDDLAFFESFYDQKDRTFYFDIGYTYGAIIPTNNYTYVLGEKA